MADPRTFTVKQCEPAYAKKSGASIGSATSSRRDFFGSLGKIGDLAVLNSVGAGKIGQGLRTLASISGSIRVGTGALPTSIGKTLDAGANWVLNTTGIPTTFVDTVRGLNPAVANQALGQAKNVFSAVKNGNFKMKDIPNVLQDFQNLERLGRNIFTPGAGDAQTTLGERCEASPYAIDLVARHPKYKFLFIVQFKTAPGYGQLGTQEGGPLDMAFVVKTSTRPNIKYNLEDVNYYNYRTKVMTKAEFEAMTMTFHDDTTNAATKFFHSYMRAMSPITGIESEGAHPDLLEQGGMDFQGRSMVANQIVNAIPANTYAASTGLLDGDVKQVFSEIRLYHLYDNGNKMNVWSFLNPRLNTLQLDDLDMSIGNEGGQLSMTFDYDSVFLDPEVDLATDKKYNILQTQRGSYYPMRYNGDVKTGSGQTAIAALPNAGSIAGGAMDAISQVKNGIPTQAFNSVRNAATAAVSDLSSKFSKALSSFPSF